MFNSSRFSQIILRLGLATVFMWAGVDKFIHNSYWVGTWNYNLVSYLVKYLESSASQFFYAVGIFEIFTGLSLITGIFSKIFSLAAVIFLMAILLVFGLDESAIKNLALIGGLLAVFFWPEPRRIF